MCQIINKTLYFYWDFNSPLTEVIFPTHIHRIDFGIQFNQKVNNLIPNHIIEITFSTHFNQDISNTLPRNLKYLVLNPSFNQELINLPISLTHLSISGNFNKDISSLPKCLMTLHIFSLQSIGFNHSLNPYLYYLTMFHISSSHKHKTIMVERCKTNRHNRDIRSNKLVSLLVKID